MRYVRRYAVLFQVARLRRWLGRGKPRSIDRVLTHNMPHVLRGQPVRRLTVSNYPDSEGGGSRALMMLFAQGVCHRFGLEYVHTPFSRVDRADRPQAEFDAAWEAFLNMGSGAKQARGPAGDVYDWFMLSHARVPHDGDLTQLVAGVNMGNRPVYYLEIPFAGPPPVQAFLRHEFAALLQPVLPAARARFRQGKPAKGGDAFTLAVHIRRGEVGPAREDMWTEMGHYEQVLEQVTGELAAQGVAFALHVHSEGEPQDFAALARFNPVLHLGGDPFASLRAMIDADVLVMARSCFSYIAALYSDGCIIYEDCPLPPLPSWIVRRPDGTIDAGELANRLAAAVAASGLTGPRP